MGIRSLSFVLAAWLAGLVAVGSPLGCRQEGQTAQEGTTPPQAEQSRTGPQQADAGLTALTRLGHLRCLKLSRTGVSDAGLATLSKLPNLRCLDLSWTKVTNGAIQRFWKARPGLHLIRIE